MANCNAIQCIGKSCGNNVGGIREIYVIDQDSVTGTTIDISAHTVTALSTNGDDFLQLKINPNTGSFTSEATVDLIAGSTYYATTIALSFAKRDAAKSYALQLLGEGQRVLTFIVLDSNGLYWYIPDAQLNGGAEQTGVAKADGSKYDVTFLADLANRVYEIDSTLISALVTPCVTE